MKHIIWQRRHGCNLKLGKYRSYQSGYKTNAPHHLFLWSKTKTLHKSGVTVVICVAGLSELQLLSRWFILKCFHVDSVRADFLFCYKVTVSTMCERTDLDVWKSFADIVVTVCLKSKVTSNSLNLDSYYVFWWFIDPSFWPLINPWNLFILSAFLMYRVEFKRITALSTNVRSSRERLAMQSRQNKQNHSSVVFFWLLVRFRHFFSSVTAHTR